MRITVHSKKHGIHEVLMDDDDYEKYKNYSFYVVRSKRSPNIYLRAHDPGNPYSFQMHRVIMCAPKGSLVDHINRNTLDNRKCNLRITNHLGNTHNSKKRPGTSLYRGVSWYKRNRKWTAQVSHNGKYKRLGYFHSELDAAKAYDAYVTENSWPNELNFPCQKF
jgi:hypothetical protein